MEGCSGPAIPIKHLKTVRKYFALGAATMAKCTYCGSEIELFVKGVVTCTKCPQKRQAQPKTKAPAPQDIRATLFQDVLEATARNNEAFGEFNAVTGQFPSGLPHPDGVQRIKNASRKLSFARKEKMKAHDRLNDYLDNGIVPEDLKNG
jgi:DNA-directed RNA polymerase subunit RPC12/RpoP